MDYVKKILTFTFLSIFVLTPVYAQKIGKIFLNERGIGVLDSKERNYVKKSVYEVVYFTGVFDLVIGKYNKNLSKEESYSIDVKIKSTSRDKQFADVKLALRDLKTQKIINVVEKNKVPRIKLQYTVRKLLFKLFYEENYDEENDRVIENRIIPIAEKSKADNSEQAAIAQSENEGEGTDLPIPDAVEGVITSKATSSKEEIQQEALKKKKKKKKNEVKISSFESPDIDVEQKTEKKIFVPTNFEFHNKFYINIGQNSSATESTTIIETQTDLKQLKFELGSRFSIGDRNDYYEAGMSVGQIMGENEYKLSAGLKFNFDYGLDLYQRYLYITPGIEYETMSFADLSTRGDGIVPWNNKLMWFGAKGRLHILDGRIEVFGGYAKSFIGTSDLGKKGESFPIEGTKLSWGAIAMIYKKLGLGVTAETVSLTSSASSSFKADNESFQVVLTYR